MYDRDTGKPKGYGFCEFAGTVFSISIDTREYIFSDNPMFTLCFNLCSTLVVPNYSLQIDRIRECSIKLQQLPPW